MSDADPDLAAPEALEDFVGRAGRRVMMLDELTRMAMGMAGALERKAIAEAELAEAKVRRARDVDASDPAAETADTDTPPPKRGPDPSAAFDRIARSVRLTIALATRADQTLRALIAGEPARVEAARAARERRAISDAARRDKTARDRAYRLMMDVAEREIESDEDLGELYAALEERLEEDPAYHSIADLPIRDVIKQLCVDLQLKPDWRRWTGEGWRPKEPFYRPPSSWHHEPSQRPTQRWNEENGLSEPPS